jgi:hypothetical protein
MDNIAGVFTPILIYATIFALNALLPGRWVTGYIAKPNNSEKMRYHLNGLTVFFFFGFNMVFIGIF